MYLFLRTPFPILSDISLIFQEKLYIYGKCFSFYTSVQSFYITSKEYE